MIALGVRRAAVPWVCSFLNNRQQCVRYNQTQSDFTNLKSDVPQGTKLGSIIFQIVINDAARGYCSNYWKYADDLTFAENRNRGLSSNLQRDLDDFLEWSISNQLKLNPDKCHGLQIAFFAAKLSFNKSYHIIYLGTFAYVTVVLDVRQGL